ncbi:RNA-guided endonuclease InsQ/TnpB family protein [Nonomuraea deserti]|uniref:RNA-guided endonuclease InsQ/TnpB family protein n=1 Tax=Nonomuraea deserti TaxID=1848322 RepID=UPI001FEAB8AF|nr:transposase [Nonomuraea deserti]
MRRSFTFLLRSTARQAVALAACLEDQRQLYNAALEHRALHAKVRRQRSDGAHKAALALVRDYDVIVPEDLRIANMTRSASGTIAQPGRNVAQKSGLNRSILDAGWGVFLTILSHEAESAGRELIAVNPAGASRTCARCGHCAKRNRAAQAGFRCTACGHTEHAGVNAAINILRAGLALRQAPEAAWRETAPFRERRSHSDRG